MFGYYAKAVVSLLISLAIIVVQWASGAYDGGITGYEWLGLAALLAGPAGLVAALANTTFSPATKAVVQQVCAVVIVLVQATQGVYSGGISDVEWIGLAGVLLSSIAVYAVPNAGYALRTRVVGAHVA